MKKTALIVAIALAGCGGNSIGSAGTETTTSMTATTAPVQAGSAETSVDSEDPPESPSVAGEETPTTVASGDAEDDAIPTTTTRPEQQPPGETVPDEEASRSIGQVPADVMASVFATAEAQSGFDRSVMTVVRAESVTWPDGSLGCPEPGMTYTMATVDGYWVELAAGDTTFDYRVGSKGALKLCESGLGLAPPDRDS